MFDKRLFTLEDRRFSELKNNFDAFSTGRNPDLPVKPWRHRGNMSMSYSSRTTPRSSASQGRIHTENTALSAILREKSNGNIAPAQRTASVYSPALDVVQSNVDVVNVSNASTNKEKQNLQYIVVSKSSASLNTVANQEHTPVHDKKQSNSPDETESDNKSKKTESENVNDSAPDPEYQVDYSKKPDSARSNAYAYTSLKSQKLSALSRAESSKDSPKSSFTGEKSERGQLQGHGDVLTKSFVKDDVIGSGDTNHNSHVNSRSNTQLKAIESDGQELVNKSDKTIAPENSDKQFAHESSGRGNSSHERQYSQLDKQRTRDHSLFSHQHTHSFISQHDRVSRGRTPQRVNTEDQLVPPLDLSGVSLPEPVFIPSPAPSESEHVIKDQNLHASDRNNSIVHFSSRDYNSATCRTYEVASPQLSSQLPHVKSSDNFRHRDDEQDTYRDRQQEPDRIEPHRSDLADELKVPYPFDTQAGQGADTARETRPPSPPVQTTPPPTKEPATSLRSNSVVYAVANPEVLRAQGIEPQSENKRQYSNSEARQSRHSAVKFDSDSRRAPSADNRTYGGSPVKDRVPTPYAKSPEREELPKTPPNWEIPKEEKSREQSDISKRGLPPQHPPLDTLHSSSKPGSRGTKRTQDDNQSIKRVYVESPSFTREEEEEYRFVSSRLEDTDDQKQKTHREMENTRRGYGGDDNPMHTYSDNRSRNRDSYAGNGYTDNRNRKTDSDYNRKPDSDYNRKPDSDYNRKPDSDYADRNRGYDKDRYEDRNQDKYDNKNEDRNGNEFYKDGYEDRQHELNGYYNERNSRDKHREGDRYRDRMKESERYDRADRYERLRDERAEYEKEPRRDDEMEYRQGYRKQNTEMDERDLLKEAEYQRDLKRRIDKQSVKMKSDKYEKEKERFERERYEQERFEKERYEKEHDYRRDSLEYPSDDRNGGFVQDSLDFNNYDQRQQEWENPPQNPYQDNPGYYPEGFIKQDSKPDFYDADDVERMDIVNPKAPKYDYVEHNKQDYGKNPQRSYRSIDRQKKEEEEKLDHIFITPKVPPKSKKKHKKAQSAQPVHMGYQAPDQYPMGFKPSSAEELWAQRARVLADKKGSAGSGKAAKTVVNKSAPRWNTNPQVKQAHRYEAPVPLPNQGQFFKPVGASYQSNSTQDQGGYSQQQGGYSQPQGGYSTPTRQLQPLENRPAAPASTEMVPTAINPASPFRRHMELKPISQEITTEDGQRISVDINLRLISPPPGQSGPGSPTQQQQQLTLLPVQESQGQYATGIPYQMQDTYGNYDSYNTGGYQEVQMVPYNNGYQTDPAEVENRYTSEELALVDPTGYSKKYQPGSVSFKDDVDTGSDMKSLEEGYAAAYHKMKNKDPSEHPWYKIYNIHDYKKMQREVRLNRGTLGPDLDTESYKEKMEKRHKQFEYARMVMEKNRMELGHKKPPKFPRQPEKQGEEGAKRKTALEYAKNVPKPAVKPRPNQYNSYEVAAQLTPGSNKARSPTRTKPSPPPSQTLDVIDIRTLEQRHLQERQKTDKIRQNMDSVLSQKAH